MASKKETLLAVVFVGLLLVASVFFYFRDLRSSDDVPPRLNINISETFKGQLTGDIVCRFNNIYEFTENDIDRYANSNNSADSYTLQSGLHLYHTETDMTIQDIINGIVPSRDNKVAIAFYNYGLENAEKGFYVYPPDGPFSGVNEIEDPQDFTIPANHGFMIMACENTSIKGVRSETLPGEDYPEQLATFDDVWILTASNGNLPLYAALYPFTDKISSIWVQTDAGFEFPSSAPLDRATIASSYQMMWIRLNSAAVAEQNVGNTTGTTGNINYNNSSCDNQCPGHCALIYNGVYYCSDEPIYVPTGSTSGTGTYTGFTTGN